MSKGMDIRKSVKNVKTIADAIKRVSKAMKQLEKSDLNGHGLVTLIAAQTLAGLYELEEVYLKPKQTEEGDDL